MRHSRSLLGTCVLVALASTTRPACADPPDPNGEWVTLSTLAGPSARNQLAFAYDPVANRMIIFGGAEVMADTWSLALGASTAWMSLYPTTSPTGRKGASMVFDSARNRMILFGGYDGLYKNDVWVLPLDAPGSWTQLNPGGANPNGRLLSLAIYDPVRDRVIVFGGTPGEMNDTWALSLSGTPQWTQLSPSGTPPAGRYGHCGIYDPVGDRMVVFGGSSGGSETWTLSLAGTPTWTQLNPATRPSSRFYATAIYDSQRARMVVYGGTSGASETWALSLGATPQWAQLTPTGTATGRSLLAAVYEPSADRMVVFGGIGGGTEVRTLVWTNQTIMTTTALQVSPANPMCGEAVTCSVQVSPPTTPGLVNIRVDGALVSTIALVDGHVEGVIPVPKSGYVTFLASYAGDDNHFASTSLNVTRFFTLVATTLGVTPSPNPAVYGQDVVVTAVCSPPQAPGKVDFYVNGVLTANNVPLIGGQATVQVPHQPAGNAVISARYNGDNCYAATVSPPSILTVNPVATSVVLSTSPNPSIGGNVVTLTATLSPNTGTGSVQFFDEAAFLGTAAIANGAASLSVSQLSIGMHSLTAVYGGDANHLSSTSPAVVQTITLPNPSIIAVRDVPNDQGGRVYLTWRCVIDKPGMHIVTGYRVWRRVPNGDWLVARNRGDVSDDTPEPMQETRMMWMPRADGVLEETFWEAIASLPAEGLINYGYTAATTQDWLPDNANYTAFFVTALTTDPWTFYESSVDSGYSIDNLAPQAPMAFTGSYQSETVVMTWNPGFEPDLARYVIYRGGSADFVADSSTMIGSTTDTTWSDPRTDPSYYKLAAIDAHGNLGAFASLTAFGLLDAGAGERAALELSPLIPNPSHGTALTVHFSLPDANAASLELLDVQGRRIEKREVGTLGAGRHAQVLSERGGLAPGVYVVRLSHGGESLTRIGAVVR